MSDDNVLNQNSPPDSAVEPCPLKRWVRFCLVRKERKKQPQWWKQDIGLPYDGEKFAATTTVACEEGKLNGLGKAEYRDIPAGSNDFQCPEFYQDIDDWIKAKLK